jgi:fumarate hydratase class II
MSGDERVERDSMGEVKVPGEALYAAQTQRALENFTISGPRFPRAFIRALGYIKAAAAGANSGIGSLDPGVSEAIRNAALEVAEGRHDEHFPLVIYQTGSATSTNMNANEVIAAIASRALGEAVHPNDHVNMGQSSNDAIPTAIHVSASLECRDVLLPGLTMLEEKLRLRAGEFADVVKTGRTHLMDAMPLTLAQEIGGWASQVLHAIEMVEAVLPRLAKLAIGGTAVGTGVNSHPDFSGKACQWLRDFTEIEFHEADDHFASQSSVDIAVELSGALKATATSLMKISNDMRLMGSGPIAGLGEIELPALQPGSSIMPGKVNPVIPEAVMMACAQVMGNDVTVGVANTHGNLELNTMLPVVAHNLLESIALLGTASGTLAEKAVADFTVNRERIADLLERSPILVTTLNRKIGYEKAAEIAKKAHAEGRPVKDVAREMTDLTEEELDDLLDPGKML